MTGVRFVFRVTLRRHDLAAEIYHLKTPRKVPVVMSRDEIERLLAMAAIAKLRAMLSLAYGCGLRAGEVVRLKVGDLDCARNIIRIVQAPFDKLRRLQGPQRDAAGRYPGPPAALVERPPEAPGHRCRATRALTLSRPHRRPAAGHAPVRAAVSGDGREGRDHQAREPAFAAPLSSW